MELPDDALNIGLNIKEIHVDDILQRSHVVALPMRVKFRGITTREALLIDGPKGWGEFSPFTEYKPQEAKHWLRAGLATQRLFVEDVAPERQLFDRTLHPVSYTHLTLPTKRIV